MIMNSTKTALVTGSTSGLGYEAAIHLANEGFGRIVVTGRSNEKATTAARALAEQTGMDVFHPLALDLNDGPSVRDAIANLAADEHQIDALLLNAGLVGGSDLTRTEENIEITFAASLIGHHRLTIGLLDGDLLAPEARIVIAGSEAARGDVPTFTPVDLPSYAEKNFAGDLEAAAQSLIRHDGPLKYKPAAVYATAKLFVAWWASSLAEQLPAGMTVNAVSPGSAPGTEAGRNANFFMRHVMMPLMKHAPKRLGMAAPVSVAAERYVTAMRFNPTITGQFYASAPKKMIGPLHRVVLPHVQDVKSRDAAWNAVGAVAMSDTTQAA
ncbi:MAG: NAD(P)-dependent dehydrogenase (short-subunit alcohol dehydrogenase family) [Verrucomicrobiales bacterium]|jgi:NAD(P)-dependent dehydrogenase (short-subunit alcohol dehydrogenase family)